MDQFQIPQAFISQVNMIDSESKRAFNSIRTGMGDSSGFSPYTANTTNTTNTAKNTNPYTKNPYTSVETKNGGGKKVASNSSSSFNGDKFSTYLQRGKPSYAHDGFISTKLENVTSNQSNPYDFNPLNEHSDASVFSILDDPSRGEEESYDEFDRKVEDDSADGLLSTNHLRQEDEDKEKFIDKHLYAIANNMISKFRAELRIMNEKGIFGEEANKTRLMHKMREHLKRIDWDYERRKAEVMFQEKEVTSYDVLAAYLNPDRTAASIQATSEKEPWKQDSIFILGKNEREMKKISKENDLILQEINPLKKFVPRYMQQTLKQMEDGKMKQKKTKAKQAPLHTLIRRKGKNDSLRAQLSRGSRSSSTSTKTGLSRNRNNTVKVTSDEDIEVQLYDIRSREKEKLEKMYENVPQVNYTLSELMEKYVEQSTEAMWESESEVLKSLSVDAPSVRLQGQNTINNNPTFRKQVSKSKLVQNVNQVDKNSHRSHMLEIQDSETQHRSNNLHQEFIEIVQKREVSLLTAYDALQAEVFESVEQRRIENQRNMLEEVHKDTKDLNHSNLNSDGKVLLQPEPVIETNIDTMKRLEQVCDVLERCIVYLCTEFRNKKSYQEASIPEEVFTMINVCQSCLRSLPIMNSRRAKRSWTKGAEIIFCWALDLENPFSVHVEDHLKKLAKSYVDAHYEIDQLLDHLVDSFRSQIRKDNIPESRSKELLASMFGNTSDSNDTKSSIGRKKVMEDFLPGLNMLSEVEDLTSLEKLIVEGKYKELKNMLYNSPGTFSILNETMEDIHQREKLAHKKKFLYVVNNYINYCNLYIQQVFQEHVKHYKDEMLNDGHKSLETEFQRRTMNSLQERQLLSKSHLQQRNNYKNNQSSLVAESKLPTIDSGSSVPQRQVSAKSAKSDTRQRVEEYVNIFNEWNEDWKFKFKDHRLDMKNPAHLAILDFRKKKEKLLHKPNVEEDNISTISSSSDSALDSSRVVEYMENESLFKVSYKQDYERRQKEKQRSNANGRYPYSSAEEFQDYKKSEMQVRNSDDIPLRDENGVLLTSFQVLQLLEQVWDDLLLSYDKKIQLYEKYSKDPFTNIKKITPLYYLWRRTANVVLERELALSRLEEFEKEASDPLRYFNDRSSVKRLQEEKMRSVIFKEVCKLARSCEREARKLKRNYQEVLEYKGLVYTEKMKTDYTNILYNLESKRLQKTEFANYEALMEALQEKSGSISKNSLVTPS